MPHAHVEALGGDVDEAVVRDHLNPEVRVVLEHQLLPASVGKTLLVVHVK